MGGKNANSKQLCKGSCAIRTDENEGLTRACVQSVVKSSCAVRRRNEWTGEDRYIHELNARLLEGSGAT